MALNHSTESICQRKRTLKVETLSTRHISDSPGPGVCLFGGASRYQGTEGEKVNCSNKDTDRAQFVSGHFNLWPTFHKLFPWFTHCGHKMKVAATCVRLTGESTWTQFHFNSKVGKDSNWH